MPVIQNKFHPKFVCHDKEGNEMTIKEEPQKGNCQVCLKLIGDREKVIGEIDRAHRVLIVKRVKSKHYFRAMCSYGFNWHVVNEDMPVHFDKVLVVEHDDEMENPGTDYYLIPLEVIRNQGVKKFFGKSGYELQWFLSLRIMMDYRQTKVKYIKGALVSKN